jgi:6-phosphogluconolactonase (cycloisomerase 2 family)
MDESAAPARFAYVGSYTREAQGGHGLDSHGIGVFAVDADTGALSHIETVPSDNPSWLALDPAHRVLYAAIETDDYEGERSGAVEAFAIDPATGLLTFLNRQSSRGLYPAHVAVDPGSAFVVVADYEGPFVVLPMGQDGRLGPVSEIVQNPGTGPDAARQEMSHPHAVTFDPAGRYLVTADLGIDRVQTYRLTREGRLDLVSEAATAPGAGPRHVAFSADARFLYVVNELNATVTVFAYDAASGTIGAEVQTISMVPEKFADAVGAAEIAVHPSGRFLYASNRGEADAVSPLADSIVVYAIDQTSGALTLIDYFSDGIDVPRGFAIDPTGTWLFVCNERGDSIVQLAIDPEAGTLTPTGHVVATPTPVHILFMP